MKTVLKYVYVIIVTILYIPLNLIFNSFKQVKKIIIDNDIIDDDLKISCLEINVKYLMEQNSKNFDMSIKKSDTDTIMNYINKINSKYIEDLNKETRNYTDKNVELLINKIKLLENTIKKQKSNNYFE